MSRKQRLLREQKQKRTALSKKNILEHVSDECRKAVHRNESMRSSVLRTNPELPKFVYIPPIKLQGTGKQ
jgi:hypothetical protein